jgi:hypothetical protein
MDDDAENKRRVVSRAEVCAVLVAEGHDAKLDKEGNVVVTNERDLELPPKELVSQLGAWRKSVHRRVAQLTRGQWVTVKRRTGPWETQWCKRCKTSMRGRFCQCGCDRAMFIYPVLHCRKGNGRECSEMHVMLYDTVVVCAMAVVPRAKLNLKGIRENNAVFAAETLLMDRKRGGAWGSFPIDVALLILNLVLKEFKLHVRRARIVASDK